MAADGDTGGMREDPRISAIVLAAGLSRRMGRPKPLVPVAGKPILAHILDRLVRSRVAEVLVVLGHDAGRVRSAIDFQGAHVVLNPRYRHGMSSSIRAGLHEAESGAAGYLLVLGDQPFVEPATINRLIAAWSSGGGKLLIPTFQGQRGNPVLIDRGIAAEAGALRGDVGFRTLFARHPHDLRELPVEDPGVLFDVDTPVQVRELETRLSKGLPLQDALREVVDARTTPPGTP